MKLATLRDGTRDGALIVVSADGSRYAHAADIARTLQAALDEWASVEPALRERAAGLASGSIASHALDVAALAAPLPRAYEWVDGSAYINHIVLVRKARGAEPPPTLRTEPLVYQGGSSVLLGPTDPIALADVSWGCDFESEVCVVLGDVAQGASRETIAASIRLVMIANDVTLRNLIPHELGKGFGFFQSKPATAFAPFAITLDELGGAWRDGRVHLPLSTWLNGALVGDPHAGPEMHFSFVDIIEHITRTRSFGAGTIVGSGTVSNEDRARGISCLAEARTRETIETGAPVTPFLAIGDAVEIEMRGPRGEVLCGRISQRVVPFEDASDTRGDEAR